jgi:pimeloyl-ACP methyl ester carboxylesterase
LDEAAFWLRDFLDAKEIESITLLGHSMGGYIAAAFADFFPERLNALGMLHSTSLADTESRKENRTKAIQFIERNGVAPFLEVFVNSLFHQPEPAWIEKMNAITAIADPKAILAMTQIMRDRPDRSEVIRQLEIPVMYITGEKDALVDPARTREELQDMPFAILKRLAEASHMGMFEAPEKVTDAILSLVAMGR